MISDASSGFESSGIINHFFKCDIFDYKDQESKEPNTALVPSELHILVTDADTNLRIFVLDVGKDLIQITRMERVDVILSLRGVRVILGVDDKHLAFGSRETTIHIVCSSVSASSFWKECF